MLCSRAWAGPPPFCLALAACLGTVSHHLGNQRKKNGMAAQIDWSEWMGCRDGPFAGLSRSRRRRSGGGRLTVGVIGARKKESGSGTRVPSTGSSSTVPDLLRRSRNYLNESYIWTPWDRRRRAPTFARPAAAVERSATIPCCGVSRIPVEASSQTCVGAKERNKDIRLGRRIVRGHTSGTWQGNSRMTNWPIEILGKETVVVLDWLIRYGAWQVPLRSIRSPRFLLTRRMCFDAEDLIERFQHILRRAQRLTTPFLRMDHGGGPLVSLQQLQIDGTGCCGEPKHVNRTTRRRTNEGEEQ